MFPHSVGWDLPSFDQYRPRDAAANRAQRRARHSKRFKAKSAVIAGRPGVADGYHYHATKGVRRG